jgi:hypothetical protein
MLGSKKSADAKRRRASLGLFRELQEITLRI